MMIRRFGSFYELVLKLLQVVDKENLQPKKYSLFFYVRILFAINMIFRLKAKSLSLTYTATSFRAVRFIIIKKVMLLSMVEVKPELRTFLI